MVYIKKLSLHAFKSFGQRKTAVELIKGLVVITGPNGGGKSNILDAIRFVTGELSPHALRVGRLSELVHEGSKGKAAYAKVSITLDNSEKALPIETDEVTISRKIYQNGESEYYINGKLASRGELLTLLSAANIRPSGFNILPQGAILNLAEMSPDDMRKLIEEVAGIAEYDRKKAEAEEQLAQADKNLEVAKASTAEVRTRVKQLEKERNQYLRRRAVEAEIAKLRTLQYRLEMEKISEALKTVQSKIASITEQIHALEGAKQEVSAKLMKLKFNLQATENEISEIERNMSEIVKARQETFEKIVKLRLDIRDSENRVGILEKESAHIQQKIAELESATSASEQELNDLELKIAECSKDKKRLEEEVARMSDEVERLRSTVKELEKKLEEVKFSKIKSERARSEAHLKLENIRNSKEQLTKEKEDVREEILTIRNKIAEIDERFEDFLSEVRMTEDEVTKLNQELSKHDFLIERYSGMLTYADEVIKKTEGIITELRIRLTTQPEDEETKKFEDFVGLLASKFVDGVAGTLGGFLKSLPEHTEKLDVVLNDWKNAIVTDNYAVTRLLSETFASLDFECRLLTLNDKLDETGRDSLEKFQTWIKNNVEFANNFEGVREKTKNGKLVVVDRKIVCYPGGFVKVLGDKRGKLSMLHAELENLESHMGVVKLKLNELRLRRDELAKKAESIRSEIQRYQAKLSSMNADIKSLNAERKLLEGSISQLMVKEKKINERIEALTKEEERVKKSLSEVDSIESIGEEQRLNMEKDFESASSNLKFLESKYTELKVQLAEKSTNLKSLEETKRKILNLINRYRSEVESLNRSLEASKLKLGEEKKLRVELESRLTLLETELHKLDQEIENLSARHKELIKIRDEIRQSISTQAEEEGEISERLKALWSEQQEAKLESVKIESQLQMIMGKLSELGNVDATELLAFEPALREQILTALEGEREELSFVNQLASEQYEALIGNYKLRSVRISELELERQEIINFIKMVEGEKLKAFFTTMEKVSEKFAAYFNRLTNGVAWLRLVDETKPSESGVEVVVQFPGKPQRSLRSVSGGERSVAAVSLLMALQGLTPADFYIFDEIDAHMDVAYTVALAELLKEMSKKTQIIIVSLKDVLAEKADQLIGVYMERGESRIIRTKLEGVEAG
ncbi:MAG: chromosome segregation SMC family protein [Nitrososphaerota archaeon]|nr:chromosome segregation protein SMC [Aigarchaeota archaeon]MDW8076904.1 chromosome segregation SMC family protein [Nitrososphaerota archaeon]